MSGVVDSRLSDSTLLCHPSTDTPCSQQPDFNSKRTRLNTGSGFDSRRVARSSDSWLIICSSAARDRVSVSGAKASVVLQSEPGEQSTARIVFNSPAGR